jgi:hypothetical protein
MSVRQRHHLVEQVDIDPFDLQQRPDVCCGQVGQQDHSKHVAPTWI